MVLVYNCASLNVTGPNTTYDDCTNMNIVMSSVSSNIVQNISSEVVVFRNTEFCWLMMHICIQSELHTQDI